jgi:hypothetical protein
MGQLLFKKCFFDAIRSGQKRTTIRRWSSARLKAGQRAFAPGLGYLTIEAVDVVRLEQLSDADALADGFDSLAQMKRMLRRLYPAAASDGRQWFKVSFRRDHD